MKNEFHFKILIIILCFHGFICLSNNRNLAATSVYSQTGNSANPPKMAINSTNGNTIIALATSLSQIFVNWYNTSGVSLKNLYLCTNGCNFPSVAQSKSGGNCVIYYNSATGQITANRYNDSQVLQKTLVWTATPISTCATSTTSGSYVFCWITSSGNILFVITDSVFGSLGSQISLGTTSASSCSISSLSNGNFIIAWSDNSNVYASIFNPTGISVVSAFQVNNSVTANRYSPFVTGLSNGNFVIVWDSNNTGTLTVYAKLYSNAATIKKDTFSINNMQYNGRHNPSVAETFTGGFVVAWQNYMQEGWDIYLKEYNSEGTSTSLEIIGSTVTAGDQTYPIVTYHPTLRYLIAYMSLGTTVFFNQAGEVRTNPICTSFVAYCTSSFRLIDFSTYISSDLVSVALLKIILKSLPVDGRLVKKVTSENLIINTNYAYDDINYSRGNSYSTPFNFIVIDTFGQMSDLCNVDLRTCYVSCATCPGLGSSTSSECGNCIAWFAKTNVLLFTNNCNHVGNTQDNSCCSNNWLGFCNGYASCNSGSNCHACNCSKVCKECNEGYYTTSSSTCSTACPIGQYTTWKSYTCRNCIANCGTCDSQSCIYCLTGYFYLAKTNTCNLTCPAYYFADTATKQCMKCSSNCINCDSTGCLTCNSLLFLHTDKLCYNPCPTGFYGVALTLKCAACSENCALCSNSTGCNFCNTSYFLISSTSTCISPCPTGFYGNTTTGLCTVCSTLCKTCSSGTECTSCNSDKFLNPINHECGTTCPSEYFKNTTNNECSLCPINCSSCLSSSHCLSCYSNYFFDNLVGDLCYSTCSFGYYGNLSTGVCTICSLPNCLSCSSATECIYCDENYFLLASTGECNLTCPKGFYRDSLNRLCASCPSTCSDCSDNDVCFECNPGFYFYSDSKCGLCPAGKYGEASLGQCLNCPENCDICSDGNSCITCSNYFYKDVDGACNQNCDPTCLTCNDGSSCISCIAGSFFDSNLNNACVQTCTDGYYGNLITGTCLSCHSSCSTCTNSSPCTDCGHNYFRDDNEACIKCESSCLTCSGSDSCTSCSAGSYFDLNLDNLCHSSCSKGFFGNDLTNYCEPCSSNCDNCTSDKICTACDNNSYLKESDKSCYITCGLGYFHDSSSVLRLCGLCPASCDYCLDSTTCTLCSGSFFLHYVDNQCYSTCPLTYFNDSSDNHCGQCPASCDHCSDSTTCTLCSSSFFLHYVDNQCYSTCPLTYFNDSSDNHCGQCPASCDHCSDSTTCTSCSGGFFLHYVDNKCYSTCPLTYFNDSSDNHCGQCPSSCDHCLDSTTCTLCSGSFFLHYVDNQCYSTCPLTYFNDSSDNHCGQCPASCDHCSDSTTCTLCSSSFFLHYVDNQCYSTCPLSYFNDSSDNHCGQCPASCDHCSDSTTCTLCSSSFFLHYVDNQCYSTCPLTYFNDSSDNHCGQCPASCDHCSDSTTCTLCSSSFFLHYVDNQCYSTCPLTYFNDSSDNHCGQCPASCDHCSDSTTCTSCSNGYNLNYLVDNLCYSNCFDGFFADKDQRTCELCSSNCNQCLDNSNCTACIPNYFLHPTTYSCFSSCPAYYFNDSSIVPNQCSSCSPNCSSCLNETICNQCSENHFLHYLVDSLCYSPCEYGYFGDISTNNCELCSSNCKLCLDSQVCNTCNVGYYLFLDNQCYSTCPNGYYENLITGTCQKCPLNCKKCIDSSICTICDSGYFLYLLDNQCYNPCPISFYENSISNQCDSCSNNCDNCVNESICSRCAQSFSLHYLINSKCYAICPDQYFSDSLTGKCESCSSDCKNCDDEKTCKECNANYFLFNKYCYSNCPNSFYNDAQTKSCIACTSSCLNCINSSTCIKCSPGFFLQPDFTCNSQCPVGYLASTSTRTCEGCPKNCNLCESTNHCNKCAQGFYLNLQNNLCTSPCPDGFFENDDSGTCDPCQANCQKCENGTQCLVCLDSYFLNPEDMSCVQKCPDFYFGDKVKKTCKGCPINCLNCQNERDCNICQPNFFLFLQTNQCHNPCPDGFYADSILAQCKQCNQLCTTCTGPYEADCILCAQPKSKVGDKCIITCPGTQIYDKSSSSCVPLNKFITNFSIQGPNDVDIEIVPSFNITVTLERNPMFKNIPLNLQLIWDNLYGGKLMNNNQTLTVYPESLSQGVYSLTVNLIILDNRISSVNINFNLRTYNLIPIVKNITALQMQQPIFLDASQSFDERDIGSTVINLEPIQFRWICPGELETICSTINTAMFMLNYDSYKQYVMVNGLSFDITLELTRDVKTRSLAYPITLNEIQQTEDSNFWYIKQETKGTLNEDLIFSVELLDSANKNYRFEDFEYYWTIPNLEEIKYLNTRKERNLRVAFSEVNNLIDFVTCQITEISTQTQYTKNSQFQSISLPFGKCKVNPPSGISGSTLFTITASNWISSNQPLQYALLYENHFGIKYKLKTFYTQSFITLLPYGKKFYLEATDSQGYVSMINCVLEIKINPGVNNLDGQFFSDLEKFTENEIYFSNVNSQYKTGYSNFNFIGSLNFINNLFDTNQDSLIDTNMEKIISFINILNSCESDLKIINNLILFNDLLEKISLKLSIISNHLDLLTKFANVVDQNLQRFYSNQENTPDATFLNLYDNIWNNIITCAFSSLISGQDIAIVTDYDRVTISKISKINLSSIKLMTTNDEGLFIIRITQLNNQNADNLSTATSSKDCGYALESDICIERTEILSILNSKNLSEIGVFIKVNNFPFIPNESKNSYLFSMNTIKVSLSTDGSGVVSRLLSQSNAAVNTQNIKYQTYLNLVPLGSSAFSQAIQSTTCVIYDGSYSLNATACNSWYDNDSKVSLCDCSATGHIANLYDQTLAEMSRGSQFPGLQYSIFNNYSMGVVLSLIIVVGSLYLIASLIDIKEGYTKQHNVKKYYDVGQSLIIDYTKLGFDKKYGLFKLFIYMVQMTHPLLSIFYIYSAQYGRGLRILDLYIQIKITFLFSLLPYYFTDNSDFAAIKSARSVSDKGKGPGDLSVAITRILWSVVYSVSGIIASKIIIGILNAIYYENILENESNKKYKYILKTTKRTYTDDVFVYSRRYKNASIKLKTLVSMRERLREIGQKRISNKQISSKINLTPNINPNLRMNNSYGLELKSLVEVHLNQINQRNFIPTIDVNEIMSPNPIYEISDNLNLDLLRDSNRMKITKIHDIYFPRQHSKSKNQISEFVSTLSEYDYKIIANRKKASISFTAFQIIDKEWLNEEYRIKKKRSALKFKLFIILFILSYIFLVIMITNVYNKYQDNIFKICITPLLSVILIRFMVTQNVMIFVHSLIMFLYGEKHYSDNRKTLKPLSLVFKFVVPPIAKSNHKALLAYRKLNLNLQKMQAN